MPDLSVCQLEFLGTARIVDGYKEKEYVCDCDCIAQDIHCRFLINANAAEVSEHIDNACWTHCGRYYTRFRTEED